MTTPTTATQIDAVLNEFSDTARSSTAVTQVTAASLDERAMASALITARATIARLEGELEVERMRLAACAVAARGGEVRDILPPYDSDSLRAVVALRTRADAAERRVEAVLTTAGALAERFESLLDFVDIPDRNCSCHISTPCSDCADYAGGREAVSNGKKVIEKIRALAAASGDTAIMPDVCSECHGDGYITVAVCCGNGHNGECCYDPEPSQEPCPKCSTATTEG